jgi:hypothetical protein
MYHAGGSRIRRNFTARPHSADGGGGGAHRAKFTGKMINRAGFLFFSSRRGPGTLVVLADVSNDLDT